MTSRFIRSRATPLLGPTAEPILCAARLLGSRLRYYALGIPTLLTGLRNGWVFLALAFRLPIGARPVVQLRNGLVFRVRTAMDVWIIKETCLDRDYEPAGFEIQNNWVVVDLGAGLGEFCIAAARQSRSGVVYAYEPFPESLELLKENIALNHVTNVKTSPLAVGAGAAEMRLKTATGLPVLHSTAGEDDNAEGDAIPVPGTSLDEVFRAQGIEHCDLLKIDCEGAEFDILLHVSCATLARVKRICLEYHNGATRFVHTALVRLLEQNGFAVRVRANPVHAHTGLIYAQLASANDGTRKETLW